MRDGFDTMYAHPDATDYANVRRIYAGTSHTERPQAF
jgi:hypothetical protein